MRRSHTFSLIILVLIIIALFFEVVRDTLTKNGDFAGYILAGNLVLDGENIYKNPFINTWPPFFSLVCVPLAIVDNFNKFFIRFIWLSMSILAMMHIIKYTISMSINRKLVFSSIKLKDKISKSTICISHWMVLVPILIVFRYILDNLANIQINIFILFLCLSSIYYFSKDRDVLAAFVLAFGISIKVYPIFLFLYFLVKRQYKIVLFSTLFCLIFSCIPVFIFGIEQTIEYYKFWYEHNVLPFASVAHKNQSYFSMMRSLLMYESPGLNQPLNQEIYVNILNLSIEKVKVVSYSLIAMAGSFVIYLFREKLRQKNGLKAFLEYSFILTITPILSPLAWKAYFIFLFPGYFINYLFLFQFANTLNNVTRSYLMVSFYVSIVLIVFTSELFVGKYISDVFEAFSCITLATILVAINILIFYWIFDKYELISQKSS